MTLLTRPPIVVKKIKNKSDYRQMAPRRQEEEVIDVDDETQDEGTVLLPVKRRKVKTKSL